MLFTAPEFADPEKSLVARQIFTIVRAFIVSSLFLLMVQIALAPRIALRWLALQLAVVALSLTLLALNRRGYVRTVSWLLLLSLWLLISVFAWTRNGLGTRAAWGYFIVVIIAGMTLGKWPAVATAGVCSASTLLIGLAAPVPSSDPFRFWLINTIYLSAGLLLQDLAVRSIRASMTRTISELHERQQVQAALANSEKKHREMVNSLPFCVFEADLNGRIQFVNQTGLDWFGYFPEDLAAGFSIYQILEESDVQRAKENVGRLLSGGELLNREYRVTRKDGSSFTVLIRTRVISEKGVPVGLQGSLIDISDLKQAERERELIISLLRATVESTADGILVVDTAGKITHYNRRFQEMWRIPDEVLAEGSDSLALAFVLDQLSDPAGFIAEVERLYSLPLAESFDLLEFRDGRYFERYSRPQMLAGQPVGRVWSFRDVSERKRSEEALLNRNRFISSLLHAMPVAVFFKDKEGRYTGCNDEFTEIMGVTSEEIMGKTVHDLWPGELAETYHQKDLELLRERKHQVYEFRVKDKHGRMRPVIYAKDDFLDANGEVNGLVGTFLDISEHKRAEMALQESELRYRTLFEAASDSILMMKGSYFCECNSKTLEMFSCTREQIVGASPDLFSPPFQPDGRSSREKALEKIDAAYAGQPQFFEWIHCKADQTPFTAEVSLNRIELSGDVFLLAIVRDITDRRRLEDQLLQAQKMEAVGILAGGVAHDFNNILSTIVGYGSLLQIRLQADGQSKEYIERILSSCERAVSLTSSLLTFSRKQEIELRPVDVNDVIYNFHKILARLIGEDIEFNLQLASQPLVVDADVRQIEQVLMNLATNSRDAMSRGGKLVIRTEVSVFKKHPGEIPAGSYAAVTVSDTGSGMNQEVKAHIFEPFFTTKETGKGTGLGLAIVYGIIKKHSGFITVDSTPGTGTAFTIFLPLQPGERRKPGSRRQERIPSGSETILLVEDDPAVRQVTRSMLEEYGYTVLEAVDGIAALDMFQRQKERIQLVLCDLIMPKMDGRETLAEMHRMKKDVKAIFMSGYTADIIAGKGITDSGIRLLLKPLKPAELLRRVRAVLDGD
jgi:two-component system cell cycle sensor histidine kinase/response regulator CckA